MMRIALTLAAALAIGAPASAKIYLATYTGTIVGDSFSADDVTGVFGLDHTGLGGVAYSAVYRIDDALSGAPIYIGPQGPYFDISQLAGGFTNGTTAIPVTATLTIKGIRVSIGGDQNDFAQQVVGSIDAVGHYAFGQDCSFGGCGSDYIQQTATFAAGFLISQDLRTPLDVDLAAHAVGPAGGTFSIYHNTGAGYHWAYGELRAEHLTIAAAVPEPATWGLLITGFGLVGGALRRRSTSLKGI